MRKGILLWLVLGLLTVGLVACTEPTPDIVTATPGATPRPSMAGCQSVPPVTDADWVRGAEDATITVIEYAEFQ